jgi:hypothetical protein
MPELRFSLVSDALFDAIPAPARPGARCQTCDYWERLDGSRQTDDSAAARDLKRSRLLAGERLAGAYAMLALDGDSVIGYAQFGPLANYPRAQVIRDRYADLPESPAPWVITCLQVVPDAVDRDGAAAALLAAVCEDLDRRGIVAVETYPESDTDAWLPSTGPATVYLETGFERVAGDDRYPVLRRELSGVEEVGWGDLLARAAPPADDDDAWPLPLPKGPSEDDLFKPLPEKPERPNPFGDD